MPKIPIPPKPENLDDRDSDLWNTWAARLMACNVEVAALEAKVKRSGHRMKNRAGGYSTAPESRQLGQWNRKQDQAFGKLSRIMEKADREPPPPVLTQAQMVAEFAATMALGRDCPDETVDQVIALTRLAAGDPPDEDAAAQVAAILAQYPSKADRAAVRLPAVDA